jgi:uncharacterized protein YbaR (Trm112 family)
LKQGYAAQTSIENLRTHMAFDKQLLDILACPVCKGKLLLPVEKNELICRFDRLAYPIKDNIPVLLDTEARELSSEELEALKQKGS